MENSLKTTVNSASSILILLPVDPSFDTVAAGLSLFLAFQGNKSTQIAASSPMTVEYNRLIGVNKIATELGNKNLVISFYDYKAEDIERVSYDIVDGQFKLTVIPKPGISAPNKDQIKLSFAGVSADTVILIGGTNDKSFPAIFSNDLAEAKLLHVGNRTLTDSSAKGILSFAQPGSSVSEAVIRVISELSLPMDPDIATDILMGIEDSTDNYKSPEVTADTFEITAALMRAGGRRLSGQGLDRSNFPAGSIPGQVIQTQPAQTTQPVQTPLSDQKMTSTIKEETPEEKEVITGEPPDDWLQPKIYKGTSIS